MNNVVSYEQLMAHAKDPANVLTQAFSMVLSRHAFDYLTDEQIPRLLERYFPGLKTNVSRKDSTASRADEFDDLLDLLLSHRSDDSEETHWLARTIAAACMGEDHLWQDMGMPNRQAMSDLLKRHFTALHDKNTANMKWKKFFYKQLCDRAEVKACRAPSCSVCNDYANCFGPEEGQSLTATLQPLIATT